MAQQITRPSRTIVLTCRLPAELGAEFAAVTQTAGTNVSKELRALVEARVGAENGKARSAPGSPSSRGNGDPARFGA
jgi:hypothetical protein